MKWLKKKFNKERKNFYYEIRDPLKRKNQVFRVNKLFSSKYMITFVCIVMNVFFRKLLYPSNCTNAKCNTIDKK